MNTKLRRGLTLLLLLVLAVSLGMAGRKQLQYRENAKSHAEALQLAGLQLPPDASGSDPEPAVQALSALDLPALQAVNPDVVGWIFIPNTELSYPLLRGPDNDFYLYRGWDTARNDCGSIFLDCHCAPDFADFHTIIYGHRMRNDSMFGTLKYYKDLDYWQEHPSVYVVLDGSIFQYDIFSAQEASVQGIVYRLDIEESHLEEEFLQACIENSVIDTGLTPEASDRILTLSTCTGSGHSSRWVVHGYLVQAASTS